MTDNKKAAQLATGTASKNTASTANHSTPTDPLQGWYDLAKPSRERQQKTAWKRGKQRGDAHALFNALSAFLSVALLALAWWLP